MALSERRRKVALLSAGIGALGGLVATVLTAAEPWLFAGRHWDVGRGASVIGAAWVTLALARMAWGLRRPGLRP